MVCVGGPYASVFLGNTVRFGERGESEEEWGEELRRRVGAGSRRALHARLGSLGLGLRCWGFGALRAGRAGQACARGGANKLTEWLGVYRGFVLEEVTSELSPKGWATSPEV